MMVSADLSRSVFAVCDKIEDVVLAPVCKSHGTELLNVLGNVG